MTCHHEFYYLPATNEDGWFCANCKEKPGEPPGYSPELDRENTREKVDSILLALHQADVIYISNSDMGSAIATGVSQECRESGLYDQYSIAKFIIDGFAPGHAKYWKEIGDGIIAGKDPRKRCHCGRLASLYVGDKSYCGFECEKQKELQFT